MEKPQTVAIIHTSFVFVNVEPVINQMFREILPEVRLINVIDDTLLSDVIAAGKVTPNVVQRMANHVHSAELAGADVIFSACSSLGPALDIAKQMVNTPVVKVDEAMAELAVAKGPRVGVLATVPSTLAPTIKLIQNTAERLGQQVQVSQGLAEGAFDKLMSGNREGHNELVLAAAESLSKNVDVIVFAQASMAYLSPTAQEQLGMSVLSSPRLGVGRVKEVLDGLKKA